MGTRRSVGWSRWVRAAMGLLLSFFGTAAFAQLYNVPGPVTMNEDTVNSFVFRVNNWGIFGSVTATSSDQAILSNASVTPVQVNSFYEFPSQRTEWKVTLRPATNMTGTVSISLRATGGGQTSTSSVTITITQVDDAPVITGLSAGATVLEDNASIFDFSVTDQENVNEVVVTATSSNTALLPEGTFNIQTIRGAVSGNTVSYRMALTPALNATGETEVRIIATQGALSTTNLYRLTVTPVNDPPLLTVANYSMTEDVPSATVVTFSDPDTAPSSVTVTATSSNAGLVPTANISVAGQGNSRTLTFTPLPNVVGSALITVTSSDGAGGQDVKSFTLAVNAGNDLPIAGSPSVLELNGVEASGKTLNLGLPTGNVPHTIEAWVQPTALQAGREWILHLGAAGYGHHWLLSPTGILQIGAWGTDAQITDAPLTVGRWTHLAAVWDGTQFTLYMDGRKSGQVTPVGGFNLATSELWLGGRVAGGERNFAGLLDEVRIWNRALTQTEVVNRMNVALRGDEPGLVGYFPFDERGGLTAYDLATTGGRTHAVLSGGATYANRHESAGLVLDGTNDRVQIPHNVAFNSYPMTVATWIRTADTNGTVASKYVDGSLNGWTFRIVNGRLRAWYFKDGQNYIHESDLGFDGGVINDGRWHHVAFAVDAAGGRIYVDGLQTGARPWTGIPGAPNTVEPLLFGAYYNQTLNQPSLLSGALDDLGYWNRALTGPEIQALWQGHPVPTGSTVAFYPLEEATGTVATDVASTVAGANNGTLIGGVAWSPSSTANAFGTQVVNEETATPIYLPGFDIENMLGQAGGATINYTIVSAPNSGTLRRGAISLTAGSIASWSDVAQNPVIYTPTNAFNGADSFTYKLTDGNGGESMTVTVPILVAGLNDKPTLTAISDRVIEEGTSTGAIPFTAWDEETDGSRLLVEAFSSDPGLVSLSGIAIGGSGTNRTITITPKVGEVGTVAITVTVTDDAERPESQSLTFRVRVDPKPAYALVDLGALSILNQSEAHDLNDSGWSVGLARSRASDDAHALLNRGLSGTGVAEDLDANRQGSAFAVNGVNAITGFMRNNSSRDAFVWRNGVFTSLAPRISGSDSIGYDLNLNGDIVGSFINAAGTRRAFLLPTTGAMIELGMPSGFANGAEALGVSRSGLVAGYSLATDGRGRAMLWNGAAVVNLGVLPNQSPVHDDSRAMAINDAGVVVGFSSPSKEPTSPRRAFLYEAGLMRGLGTLTNGTFSEAWDINSFGQVVGRADIGTQPKAFLYTSGAMRDLNDLIHDARVTKDGVSSNVDFKSSGWSLEQARAINTAGAIVGIGTRDGNSRAFLAVPAWVIGKQIARPEGAVERLPEIELITSGPTDTKENAFHWSPYEKKLYALRPVTARLRWFTSFLDTTGSGTNIQVNTDRIVVEGISVWPKDPVMHVANAPVEVEPKGVAFNHSYQSVIYQSPEGNVVVDPTSKTLNASEAGFSVIYYLETRGVAPNPVTQSPYFEVVRTIPWDHPDYRQERGAVVGQVITDARHQDYLGKSGYVLTENAFYDGAGPDRAYDRQDRLGSIIPVNLDTPSSDDDLVVVWYRFSRIGVAWAGLPVRYSVSWPTDDVVDKIVIASGKGSGPLPANCRLAKAYHQPNPKLPGFNPNEEHAFVAPAGGTSGTALFALRNDLNAALPVQVSEPYALLKYKVDGNDQWRIRVYKVLAEDAVSAFRLTGKAGAPIQPPYPLSILPLCEESTGVDGPWWEDWKGTLYARAAGPNGGSAEVTVRWFYPLQSDFFYDLDQDGVPDAAPGSCVAWLDRRATGALTAPNSVAGTAGTPILTTYRIAWPKAPILQIGETLFDPKNGLPGVKDMASLKLVYDDLTPGWNPLNPTNTVPVNTLARLYDPLSERVLKLTSAESIPSTVKRSQRGGKEYFDDLPPTLATRLRYDPINRWLIFGGVLDTEIKANPLLMPNVLGLRERDAIRGLAAGNVAWEGIVDRLYDLTRNPNGVDYRPADGKPDSASDVTNILADVTPGLRLGLTTLGGRVVPEPLGNAPKALTAALGGVPSATNNPVSAVDFDGASGALDLGPVSLAGRSFTLEMWAKRSSANTRDYVAGMGTAEPAGQMIVGFDSAGRFVFRFGEFDDNYAVATTSSTTDTNWHHWAVTFDNATLRQTIYRDGLQVAQDTSSAAFTGSGSLWIGRRVAGAADEYFHGRLDEIRVWDHARSGQAIARDRTKALTSFEDGLVRYFRCDSASGTSLVDSGPDAVGAKIVGSATLVASDAPTGKPPRYLVLAENDDASLAGSQIKLHIIQVEDGPAQGYLKAILPGNVFDQRLTMRHNSDFGGNPDAIEFDWYTKSDEADFNPVDLPTVNADGTIGDLRGWIRYSNYTPSSGRGVNDVTLGNGGESGLLTLGDNWFICRIRGYNVRGETNWSGWIGDPSGGGTPRAQLAEGWIKRVLRGLNTFDSRTKDFHSDPAATFASMILQAGGRYEGDIAFNPDGAFLNSIGLIEAYTTVLNRGKSLSIEATPPVNFNPANNALLLAAGRIADLYMLLGNEAYADAQDPTTGFATTEAPYRAQASSIFSFQNQLDSLLEEELALLRGRDDRQAGVAASPVYNRLFWNFTQGEGELAYQQNYNISDQNFDGFIDENDARTLYPQGHGDAWGHYLTAITTYYDLLRHPQYTWVPRTERVTVGSVPVEVDYRDERKFAKAAAARARAGSEIVNLSYRANYVDDPDGQWQGYKDTDTERSWGVAEWAWRAGQGAYFDWLTANTILPATDPNPAHTGIQKVDRTTVNELDEILAQFQQIQAMIDQADAGLNPLGLVKGAMVFDLDPTFLAVGSTAAIGRQAVQGLAHFEQLNERAIKALKNAQRIWDEANAQSQNLRETQDSVDEFTRNVRDQDRDFRNRLIEIYGYPYAGDIGPGRTYPSGYSGPDLYHYMYVPVAEITGETMPPAESFTGFFTNTAVGLMGNSFFPSEEKSYFTEYDVPATDPIELKIHYPQTEGPWAFSAPSEWGSRRAPGRLQEAISDVLQATARLKFVGQNYDGLILDIGDRVEMLKAQFNLTATNIAIKNKELGVTIGLNAAIGTMYGVQKGLERAATIIRDIKEGTLQSVPKVVGLANDVLAPARLIITMAGQSLFTALETSADALDVTQNALELSKEMIPLTTELEILKEEKRFEAKQMVRELEALVRNEINLRLEVFEQEEVLRQAYGRYLSTIAEGQRLLDELVVFRKDTAADTTEYRYRDMAFRVFRNEAIQKYRATFDLAARYVYLCATAYDFESNFLGSDRRSASRFFDQIIRQRQLGVLIDGEPIPGDSGLADIQGRMIQNWEILEPQFGLNNPQLEAGRFSLRNELFRLRDADPDRLDDTSDENWRGILERSRVEDLWQVPEFRRYCRPFAVESAGKQPALVIRFPSTVQFGQNFFGHPLSGGDSAFDPTFFSTKINAVGIGFPGYDDAGLSRTPRVYLLPVGMDVLRAPTGSSLETREWRVLDQAVPVPFAIGSTDYANPSWIPSLDALSETYGQPRRFAALRAFSDNGDFEEAEMTASTRLVARSVWNTEWMLIIPGGTLLADPNEGLNRFIHSVADIKLMMMVYSYAGQ
ncbi:MAG: tandem-95 repeat protein [Verrucomicrobiales bacterium]|nr:tandem-95 repeat protein [Verrucomicrobiales bacterium]